MAKTNSQKWYDDLEALIDKYPHMKVSQVMVTTQQWMDAVWRRLEPAGKTKVTILKDVKGRYRLG
jgi:hypothetical protein